MEVCGKPGYRRRSWLVTVCSAIFLAFAPTIFPKRKPKGLKQRAYIVASVTTLRKRGGES